MSGLDEQGQLVVLPVDRSRERLSVGFEDPDDLIADLEQALA